MIVGGLLGHVMDVPPLMCWYSIRAACQVDEVFNDVLAAAAEKAVSMGALADNLSVGTALSVLSETRDELVGDAQQRLFQWHIANIEFANAMLADKLSVSKWSLDDAFDFDGDHVWLPGGNVRLVAALAEGVPVLYNSVVKRIRYCSAGVEVDTDGVTYAGALVVEQHWFSRRSHGLGSL